MKIYILSIIALIYIATSSCARFEPQESYPAVIKKFKLEQQFDIAKWELYKINSILINEFSTDFVVVLQGDDELRSYSIERQNYQNQGKNLFEDEKRLAELFGEDKIARYTNCELELFPIDIDSSNLFIDGEIQLSFFPKFIGYENYYVHKLGNKYCTTVIFEGNQIKRIGCDDYREWDYEAKFYPDSMFYKLIEKRKEEISPWLLNEYERRIKLVK